MALYYPNFQRDSLPTSYVGEQKIVFFPEPHLHPGNMTMYLNQTSSAGSFSEILSASSLSPRNCVGIASVGGRNEMVFIPPTSDTVTLQSINGQLNSTPGIMGNSLSGDSEVIPRTQSSILDGEQNFGCQGLSLSLGTQLPSAISVPSLQYQYQTLAYPSSGTHLPVSGKGSGNGDETEKNEELRNSGHMPSGFNGGNYETVQKEAFWNLQCSVNQKEMHSDICHYDPAGFANTILHSRYLKAAQQLLDEVVNLRKTLKQPDSNKRQRIHGIGSDDPKGTDGKSTCHSMNQISSDHNESASNSSELSPSERQVLQNKKAKLMSMLDEVDKRYKQYYHQMQVVVSSFEMATGSGAAKTYTALALQTISRHFRCLRDVISDQIRVTQRRLGEQDTSQLDEAERIPRLRFVDHQLRQQKALQQLGVMRPAWRPQRGLPESSVSILRAWLFEHFLHPYPKDSEKLMLAKQTGLTKNQVANWFINARVRLWKPMIEDMYKEEFGDSEMNSKSSQGNAHKMEKENSTASEVKGEEFQDSMTSSAADPDVMYPGHAHDLKSNHFSGVEINRPSAIQSGAYANNISISSVMNLPGDQRHGTDDHGLNLDEMMPENPSSKSSLMTSAAASYISELDGFTVGSQVSLALGLQKRHETNLFSMSGGDIRGNKADSSSTRSDMVDYHCMDLGNQQDRFSNAHQLHDFVV